MTCESISRKLVSQNFAWVGSNPNLKQPKTTLNVHILSPEYVQGEQKEVLQQLGLQPSMSHERGRREVKENNCNSSYSSIRMKREGEDKREINMKATQYESNEFYGHSKK